MTQQQEIEKQVMDDYLKFQNEAYHGAIAVPENIITLFKSAALALAPQFHKVHGMKIQAIASMTVRELTNGLLNDAILMIQNTPLSVLYPGAGFEEAVLAQVNFEKFIIAYNSHITDCQDKIKMKKKTLESLVAGPLPKSGMRVVPN